MNVFILFLNLRKALLIPAERRVDIALNYMFNREKFCHAVFFMAVIGSALCVFTAWQGCVGQRGGDAAGFRDGELHQPLGDQKDQLEH